MNEFRKTRLALRPWRDLAEEAADVGRSNQTHDLGESSALVVIVPVDGGEQHLLAGGDVLDRYDPPQTRSRWIGT